jgi:hypothetical protein
MTQPSPGLIRFLQAMGDARVTVVIHNGVFLETNGTVDGVLMDKFCRQLTEDREAEIIAVFGPGPHYLDWEFLQEWCRPCGSRQVIALLAGYVEEVGMTKAMAVRDCELAEESTDRKLKDQLGVAEGERLMVAVYLPVELRELHDVATPEEEAAAIVARLQEPVAMMSEDGELLSFVRPSKSA